MTIAITGATGQLGTLTIDALLARGVPATELVALARDTAKAQPLADRGLTVRAFDYTQPETLVGALEGVEKLLLISGTDFGQRFTQHQAVIDAAVQAGVRTIFYTSVEAGEKGPGASKNPVSPEHAQTEDYLAQASIDAVILRNGWYSENYLGQLESAPATGAVLTSAAAGSQVASAARKDYAEAAAAALTAYSPKALYRLTGDTAWDQDALASDVAAVTGAEVTVQRVDAGEQQRLLTEAGLDERTIGFVIGVDAAISDGELGATTGELAELIGHPTTPLVDTLRAGAPATV